MLAAFLHPASVRRVEAIFRLAHAIEKRLAAATTRAEKLTQAILAKALRGELGPHRAEMVRREGRARPALATTGLLEYASIMNRQANFCGLKRAREVSYAKHQRLGANVG